MGLGLLRAALPVILAGTVGLQLARADIYTWTDASGRVNVSNLAPPEGVRVTHVVHENAPTVVPRSDPARDAARDAEVQALAERVRQLQYEVDVARRQMPPQVEYRAVAPPPAMPYGMDVASPLLQYAVTTAQPAYGGCDVTWMDCGFGWGQGIYPAGVVVSRTPSFRRFYPMYGGRHFPAQQPIRAPGGPRRR